MHNQNTWQKDMPEDDNLRQVSSQPLWSIYCSDADHFHRLSARRNHSAASRTPAGEAYFFKYHRLSDAWRESSKLT